MNVCCFHRRGVSDVIDDSDVEEPDAIDVDDSDQKSYESVQNMILGLPNVAFFLL